MATEHRAISGGGGDWNSTSSWHTGAVPAKPPQGIAEDTALFDRNTGRAFATNMDRTTDNPILRIITMEDYPYDVATSANPLIHYIASAGTTNGRVIHRGTGRFFFEGVGGGVSDVFCNSMRSLDLPSAMELSGAFGNIVVQRGFVEIASSASIVTMLALFGPYSHVVWPDGAGTPPKHIRVLAGTLDMYMEPSSVAGASIIVGPLGRLNLYGRIPTGCKVDNIGGIVKYDPASAPTASHRSDLLTYQGNFDLEKTVENIEWGSVFIGPDAGISGAVLQESALNPTGTLLDMRKPYP